MGREVTEQPSFTRCVACVPDGWECHLAQQLYMPKIPFTILKSIKSCSEPATMCNNRFEAHWSQQCTQQTLVSQPQGSGENELIRWTLRGHISMTRLTFVCFCVHANATISLSHVTMLSLEHGGVVIVPWIDASGSLSIEYTLYSRNCKHLTSCHSVSRCGPTVHASLMHSAW